MRISRFLTITEIKNYLTQIFNTENYPIDALAEALGMYGGVVGYTVVYNNSFSIPDDSWQNVSFTNASHDTLGMWDIGVPDALFFPVHGLYLVTSFTEFSASTTGIRSIVSQPNGGVYMGNIAPAMPTGVTSLTTSGLAIVTLDGYSVGLSVYQNSGGSLTSCKARIAVAKLSKF